MQAGLQVPYCYRRQPATNINSTYMTNREQSCMQQIAQYKKDPERLPPKANRLLISRYNQGHSSCRLQFLQQTNLSQDNHKKPYQHVNASLLKETSATAYLLLLTCYFFY
jgi:hypothetical protein